MYAIIHLPTAGLIGYIEKRWAYHEVKTLYFDEEVDAKACLSSGLFKKSNGSWEGTYLEQDGNGSLQHVVPKYLLEVIEVPYV